MHLSSPISCVIPGARGVVLELLAGTFESLTGNQIAEMAGGRVSQSGVSKALGPLVESGLVVCRPAGSAHLYTLNREHVGAAAVVDAASMRDELLARISRAVATWPIQPLAVWLFGSAARASGDSASDIDLFVLRSNQVEISDARWEAQTLALTTSVTAWSGNACELLEYSAGEFAKLVKTQDHLVTSLRDDALVLYGSSARDLMEGGRR